MKHTKTPGFRVMKDGIKNILLRNKEVKTGDSKHDKTDLKSI